MLPGLPRCPCRVFRVVWSALFPLKWLAKCFQQSCAAMLAALLAAIIGCVILAFCELEWDAAAMVPGLLDQAYEFPVGVIKFLRCRTAAAAAAPAAASKCVGSDCKVSEKDLGEMKENEKEQRVQFFVKHGSTSSVVRSSSLDVVSDVLQLHADEYAVCGSRMINMESTLSQNGIGNGSNVQVLRRLRGGAGAYLGGSAKCVTLRGVGLLGSDAIGVMLLVIRFQTTFPWVLWDGRPHRRVVLVLLLAVLFPVMFHLGVLVLSVPSPSGSRCWS